MTKKLQIKLSDQAEFQMRDLMNKLDIDSFTSLIKNSVSLFRSLHKHYDMGSEIIIRERNGREKRIVFHK